MSPDSPVFHTGATVSIGLINVLRVGTFIIYSGSISETKNFDCYGTIHTSQAGFDPPGAESVFEHCHFTP